MNTTTESPPSRSLRPRRRWLRRILWTLALLLTVAMLFHAEENWRGSRAWKQTRERLEVLGEPLRWEDRIKPVPDQDNFFAAPIVKERILAEDPVPWFLLKDREGLTEVLRTWGLPNAAHRPPDFASAASWLRGHSAEALPATQHPTPAQDVLDCLRPADAALLALHEALHRPLAMRSASLLRVVANSTIPEIRSANALLLLRASSAFATGDYPKARQDWGDAVLLSQKWQSSPSTMMDHLLSAATLSVTAQSMWMVCRDSGNPTILTELVEMLATVQLLQADAIRDERIFAVESMDSLIENRKAWLKRVNSAPPLLWYCEPSGWFRLKQSATAEHLQARLDAIQAQGWRKAIEVQTPVPWPSLSLGTEPLVTSDRHHQAWQEYSGVMSGLLRVQSRINAIRVALALAAHRSSTRKLPSTLDELSSLFTDGRVPLDLMTDQPFVFRPNPDGSFTLRTQADQDEVIIQMPPL